MRDEGIARWFVESAGFDGKQGVDPWELAKRWGFKVRLRNTKSGEIPRTGEFIWLDPRASHAEHREALAYELAAIAMELSREKGDPARLAAMLLGTTSTRHGPERVR